MRANKSASAQVCECEAVALAHVITSCTIDRPAAHGETNGSAVRDARPRRPDPVGSGRSRQRLPVLGQRQRVARRPGGVPLLDRPAPLSLESCWDAEIVRQGRGAASEAQFAFRLAATPPKGGASFGCVADGVFREPQIRCARQDCRPTASAMALGYAGHHEFELKIHLDRWAADVPVQLELCSVSRACADAAVSRLVGGELLERREKSLLFAMKQATLTARVVVLGTTPRKGGRVVHLPLAAAIAAVAVARAVAAAAAATVAVAVAAAATLAAAESAAEPGAAAQMYRRPRRRRRRPRRPRCLPRRRPRDHRVRHRHRHHRHRNRCRRSRVAAASGPVAKPVAADAQTAARATRAAAPARPAAAGRLRAGAHQPRGGARRRRRGRPALERAREPRRLATSLVLRCPRAAHRRVAEWRPAPLPTPSRRRRRAARLG